MTGTRRVLLCCALVLCSLAAPAGTSAQAQSAPASFGVTGPDSVSAGETVTLNVTLAAETPAYAVSFNLQVEGGRALSVKPGPFLGSDLLVLERSANGDSVSFGATRAGVDSGVTGSGTVAQVTVAVPENASGPLSLSFSKAGVADPNATDVETTATGLDVPLADADSGGSNGSDGGSIGAGGDTGSGGELSTAADVSDGLAAATGSTAVVAQVAEGTALDSVRRALRANGARSTYVLPDSHAVGARIDAAAAGTLAGIEGVTALRTAAEAEPSGAARISAESVGAGRVRTPVAVPDSVPRVVVSVPDLGGTVSPERIAFDAAGANGTLTVTASGVPADAPAFEGDEIGGFTVSHPGIEATNVTLRFAVEGDADGTTLYRLDGSWSALPTERVDGGYRAESPGLSAFLVGSNGTGDPTTTTATGSTTAAAGGLDGNATRNGTDTAASGGTPGFTPVAALLVLAFAALASERREE